jgi:hypothetical protein
MAFAGPICAGFNGMAIHSRDLGRHMMSKWHGYQMLSKERLTNASNGLLGNLGEATASSDSGKGANMRTDLFARQLLAPHLAKNIKRLTVAATADA